MADSQFEAQVQARGTRNRFSSFFGRVIDQMPELLEDNRIPIDGAQLVHERALGENKHDRETLRSNYVVVSDVNVTDPEGSGEVLVARYNVNPAVRELVNDINPESKITSDWGLEISRDQYQAIKEAEGVLVVPPEAANTLRDSIYSNPESLRERFWEHVSGGDQQTLGAYKKMVEETTGRTFERNAMGFYPSGRKGLQPLWFNTVGYFYSRVDDDNYLISNLARLVGVAAEPLAPEKIGTQSKLAIASLDEVLEFGGNQDDFAPNQLAKLRETMRSGGYEIVKR